MALTFMHTHVHTLVRVDMYTHTNGARIPLQGGRPGTEGASPTTVLTHTIWVTLAGPPLQFHRGPWSDGQAGGRQVAVVQDSQTPPLTFLSAHPRGAWGWGGTLESGRLCLTGSDGCVCLSLGPCVSLCHVGPDVCMFRVGQQRWAWLARHAPIILSSRRGLRAEETGGAQLGSARGTLGSLRGGGRPHPGFAHSWLGGAGRVTH